MSKPTPMIKLQHIDHVAIYVENVDISMEWYQKVFGFEHILADTWGKHPAFVAIDNFGIAIFPAKTKGLHQPDRMHFKTIDHFAFRISNADFKTAQAHYQTLDIPFTYQNHTAFESIYIQDPDGHTLELTTPID